MEHRIDFQITLKNERSMEIHSHAMNSFSILSIPQVAYLSKRNDFQQLSTASIKKASLLIEHHIITGTKKFTYFH